MARQKKKIPTISIETTKESNSTIYDVANSILNSQKQLQSIGNSMSNVANIFINSTYLQYIEQLARQNEWANEFNAIIEQMKPIAEMLANIINNNKWLFQLAGISERFQEYFQKTGEDLKVIAPILLKAGLWITPGMPTSFVRQVIELAKKPQVTTTEIETLYIENFHAQNGIMLRMMVESWSKNRYFSKRMKIITDAMEAHFEGKYTLSIPTVLPQIEGITAQLNGKPAGKTVAGIKQLIGEEDPNFMSSASTDILLDLIPKITMFGSIKEQDFSPEKFSDLLNSKGIPEDKCLNRHAILHGIQINYANELSSLKLFMLLDTLNQIKDQEIVG